MKKLVLLMCLSFVAVAGFAQTSVFKSLNGYDERVAKKMIARFNKVGTQPPQITSVWFDKIMVQNMIALLNSENSINRPTDGVRIYYAYDDTGNETVVLVSTYDSRLSNSDSYENANYHYDNWAHSSSAPLYNMQKSISGAPCHDDCKHGALLYVKTNDTNDVPCDQNNPHYLSRSLSEDMVIGYAKQKIKINTRAEWFDLDMINGFMDVFQNKDVDGIRIYFALNPVNNSYTLYGGMDAFVIVATTGSNVDPDFHKDYFDCSLASDFFKHSVYKLNNQLNIKLKSYFRETDKAAKDVMFTGTYGGQDNGQLCPFNCN